jgi:hypothetical protein
MAERDLTHARWRTSSRSASGGGGCVEVARIADGVAVRDSKAPAGGVLVFSRAAWTAFLDGVRQGEFDRP